MIMVKAITFLRLSMISEMRPLYLIFLSLLLLMLISHTKKRMAASIAQGIN